MPLPVLAVGSIVFLVLLDKISEKGVEIMSGLIVLSVELPPPLLYEFFPKYQDEGVLEAQHGQVGHSLHLFGNSFSLYFFLEGVDPQKTRDDN